MADPGTWAALAAAAVSATTTAVSIANKPKQKKLAPPKEDDASLRGKENRKRTNSGFAGYKGTALASLVESGKPNLGA